MDAQRRWQSTLIREAGANPYRSWLQTAGSLTQRLRTNCSSFRVEPVKQALDLPLTDEAAVGRRQRVWLREVFLFRNGMPVVFAHSVLARSPRHPLDRLFRGLGSRALGSLLFADPRFHRQSMRYLQLDQRHALYQRLAAVSQAKLPARLWARRARFVWKGKTLLVTEVFLPSVLNAKYLLRSAP